MPNVSLRWSSKVPRLVFLYTFRSSGAAEKHACSSASEDDEVNGQALTGPARLTRAILPNCPALRGGLSGSIHERASAASIILRFAPGGLAVVFERGFSGDGFLGGLVGAFFADLLGVWIDGLLARFVLHGET